MSIPDFRSRLVRRCTWVLWLALLLPAAQSLAAWHAQAHVRGGVEAGVVAGVDAAVGDPRVAHLKACDLCLTLAGIAHAAPPVVALQLDPLRLAHALPPALPALPDGAATLLAYRGRAPPDAPR